jgi:sodium-dependent dicarboxylate transporter 2/3/5
MTGNAVAEEMTARLLPRTAAFGLALGIVLFVATLLLPPPEGLSVAGWRTLGLALMMAVWWSTEPVPMAVTSLLPLIIMPLAGIADMAAAAAPFANPIVYLFFGGFLLSTGLSKWGLHRRIAFAVISRVGSSPRLIVLGFMTATAFLSMWINNTSTVMLMLPVALSVLTAIEDETGGGAPVHSFGIALLLGVAYSASIGGVGTLVGTAPNALFAGFMAKQYNVDISFISWMAVAAPLVVVFIVLGWVVLTRVASRLPESLSVNGAASSLIERLSIVEPMSRAEWRVSIILLSAAALWLFRPLLTELPFLSGLTDAGISIMCATALFLTPTGDRDNPQFLLKWSDAQTIPWHVLLLFGGGLSLAEAMDDTGLARWIGDGLSLLGALPTPVFIFLLVASIVAMSELASNTALVAALLPVVAAIAANTGIDLITIAIALTIAASCAFMLPVGTPPNALVYATGRVTVPEMIRAGFMINVLGTILITLTVLALVPIFFGDIGTPAPAPSAPAQP